MKRISALLVALVMVLGASMHAHAALILRGTDTQGNRLIYDDDLDITWYDYTNGSAMWQTQVNWADALTVDFGGTVYDDWRLPTTVDGPYVSGYDGTTTGGYNITTNEIGHLFYTELGNLGYRDTSGRILSSWGLTNTGLFQNFKVGPYWFGTEYSTNSYYAWYFLTYYGYHELYPKHYSIFALAVRDGDVPIGIGVTGGGGGSPAPVPEPSTIFLLGSGLAGLVLTRKRFGRRHG